MAHEAYKELVTSAHLIQAWAHKAWGLSGLGRFLLILWDFLNVYLQQDLVLGGCLQVSAEPRIGQSGCLGVVLGLHNEGQQAIVTSPVHQTISGLRSISHMWIPLNMFQGHSN